MSTNIKTKHIHISGIVQGVGFRPFVYNLALRHNLTGWVLNNSSGVDIEVSGSPATLDVFIAALQTEKPPLAVIDSLTIHNSQSAIHHSSFTIRHSQAQPNAFVPISPDIAICDDCLRELFDPTDRRFGYPFINCTNCGPRFTIIQDIPYDRPLTTMAAFAMCANCQQEYDDPGHRRFHAQPNACPVCGPEVVFQEAWDVGRGLNNTRGAQAIEMAQAVLADGGIVAVKGLGGFHLACDAANDAALQTLRERKGRVDKPFAVMAPDIAIVETFAQVNAQERALLTSKERPIVLLKKKANFPLSSLVAPGNPYIGVMLPYTPLHYLILEISSDSLRSSPHRLIASAPRPLVMTSGNISEEPIVTNNAAALERLATLADAFLLHNRDIYTPCDDSVVRVFQGRELPIRRSRGYAPFPVKLPFPVANILAVGGELKNTFCLTRDNYAFISQHIGDMENLETLQAFEHAVTHFESLFRISPQVIACDMHPGYLSTQWAEEKAKKYLNSPTQSPISQSPNLPISNLQSPQLLKVQHHHAHLAAVMAEHGLDSEAQVIGISFDGTGYGPDGAIWGGEIFICGYHTFTRAAHLKYIPLPGGDAAIKRPYRTALAHLWAAEVDWVEALPPVAACSAIEQGVIRRQLETGLNSVSTSSMGRLFDAVAALVGIRQTVTYEAQAAIEFEAMLNIEVETAYEFGFLATTPLEIDAAPVIRAVAADVLAGVAAPQISAKFHHAVANLVVQLSVSLREKTGLNSVALSGGVFQNVTLLEMVVNRLTAEDFTALTHWLVPPNDGGLALGQAVVAHFQTENS